MQEIMVEDPKNPMAAKGTDWGRKNGYKAWDSLTKQEQRLVCQMKAQWKAMAIDGCYISGGCENEIHKARQKERRNEESHGKDASMRSVQRQG